MAVYEPLTVQTVEFREADVVSDSGSLDSETEYELPRIPLP